MDHFDVLQELGFASRLKRLSEIISTEVKAAYAYMDIEFDPKWFPLFSLLLRNGPLSVTEAANRLGWSHPNVILLAKEMTSAKLIKSAPSPTDKRSRQLSVTKAGLSVSEKLKPLWQDIHDAVEGLIAETDPHFLNSLRKFEQNLSKKPFLGRINDQQNKKFISTVRIEEFKPVWKKEFERLNLQWLGKFFDLKKDLEETDRKHFQNPEHEILKKGGAILFAVSENEVLATCALIRGQNGLELAKMAVSEPFRGRGIGELLAKAALAKARLLGEKKLTLLTHTKLHAALQLYTKLGFRIKEQGQSKIYKRANLMLELDL